MFLFSDSKRIQAVLITELLKYLFTLCLTPTLSLIYFPTWTGKQSQRICLFHIILGKHFLSFEYVKWKLCGKNTYEWLNILISYRSYFLFTGFGLGGLFGLFTAGVDPMSTMSTETPTTRMVLKEMRARFWSYGKNFAIVGAMFAGTECCLETVSSNAIPLYYFMIKMSKVFTEQSKQIRCWLVNKMFNCWRKLLTIQWDVGLPCFMSDEILGRVCLKRKFTQSLITI